MEFPFGYFIFDIDGTLANARGKISERTCASLAAVRANGAAVIVATGRPFHMAVSVLDKIGGQADFLLSHNGAVGHRVAAAPQTVATKQFAEWTEVAPPSHVPDGATDVALPLIREALPGATFMTCKYGQNFELRHLNAVSDPALIDTCFSHIPPVQKAYKENCSVASSPHTIGAYTQQHCIRMPDAALLTVMRIARLLRMQRAQHARSRSYRSSALYRD